MPQRLVCQIPQAEIAAAVARLAADIDTDHAGRELLLVGVLRGVFVFLADLARQLRTPLTGIEFMQFTSYGDGVVSSGQAKLRLDIAPESVAGRDVLLVEDIIDTGLTTTAAIARLRKLGAGSVKLCVLLDKPARRRVVVPVDYVGFTVPDLFLVGYGLDLAGRYRQLPDICVLECDDGAETATTVATG